MLIHRSTTLVLSLCHEWSGATPTRAAAGQPLGPCGCGDRSGLVRPPRRDRIRPHLNATESAIGMLGSDFTQLGFLIADVA
jgi:hypothetical protein